MRGPSASWVSFPKPNIRHVLMEDRPRAARPPQAGMRETAQPRVARREVTTEQGENQESGTKRGLWPMMRVNMASFRH